MTQKEFATRLLAHIGASDVTCFSIFSDSHVDGTKVLRIKKNQNPTSMTNEEVQQKLESFLANYLTITGVTVRDCDSYSNLNWCIQVEYRDFLPDLGSPEPAQVPSLEPKETVLESGMIRVETPFGVGYATDEADKARMLLWLEGVKAGMAYVQASQNLDQLSPESEDEEDCHKTEDDFYYELSNILADSNSEWWECAEEIEEDYPDLDSETAKSLMDKAFDEWR